MKPVICGDDALHITTQGCSDCDQLEGRVEVLETCCHDVTNALNSKLEANNIVAGTNITVTQSGKNVTINSTGGGGDLTNYYTKTEVDELLSDIEGMEFVLVDTLPATGQKGKIYLLKKAGTTDRDEYIWVNNAWELIGDTAVDLTNYYNKTEVNNLLNNKVDKVTGKGLSTNDYTTAEKNKLAGIAAGAEVNVQSDWNQTDATKDDFIKNKPTNATQAKDGFMSKTDKKKLDGIEEGAEVNVQADWNQTDSTKDDFIKNKPDLSEFLTCDTLSDCRGYFTGLTPKTIVQGEAFDPSEGVTAFSKDDVSIPFTSLPTVDINTPGTYQVVYFANGVDPVIRTITVTEPVTQAYAYIDTSNNEMHFFRDDEGKYIDGQVEGTKTYYTGFETSTQTWGGQETIPTTVIFDDVIAPVSTNSWFARFSNLTTIENIGLLDTSNVTDMACMFQSCERLTALDVSSFDTSKVTKMNNMFATCERLTTLDVSGFDTSSVTDMGYMFDQCYVLDPIDVSGWNTSNVTTLERMFYQCLAVKALDVSGWNTSKVTRMDNTFTSCQYLTTLDVSGWDTSNVTNMASMFKGCRGLTTLDVSGWDTSNVTNMGFMFEECHSLTNIDVSGWDTPSVTKTTSMFKECRAMTNIDLSGWDTSNVTDMSSMFYDCRAMTNIDLSGWDTSNVTGMSSMFELCGIITTLDLSSFDTSKVTTTGSMFCDCSSLSTIYASPSFVVNQVTSSGYMFAYCSNLVGGAGTPYSYSNRNKIYARIDNPPDAPGYFTAKP